MGFNLQSPDQVKHSTTRPIYPSFFIFFIFCYHYILYDVDAIFIFHLIAHRVYIFIIKEFIPL